MALVNITNVQILNSSTAFSEPFSLEITFECLGQLDDDLEFKFIYVGSAESDSHDQTLESILVGPVPLGLNKFTLETPGPNPQLIPSSEVVGLTVVILSVAYKEQEFVKIGYYVNVEYEQEELRENPPEKVDYAKLKRTVAEKPKVTRYPIKWGIEEKAEQSQVETAVEGSGGMVCE